MLKKANGWTYDPGVPDLSSRYKLGSSMLSVAFKAIGWILNGEPDVFKFQSSRGGRADKGTPRESRRK